MSSGGPLLLDRRSVRFAALIASILLGCALALGPIDGLALVAVQMFAFATGAIMGPRSQPFVSLYRRTFGRRGKPATTLVPAAAEQFGQTLGLVATFIALMGGILSAAPVFLVATAVALIGTLVQTVFGVNPLATALARATGRPATTVRVEQPGTEVYDDEYDEADLSGDLRVDLTEQAYARDMPVR